MVVNVLLGLGDAGGTRVVVAPQGVQPAWPFLAGGMDGPVQALHQIWKIAVDFQSTGGIQVTKGQIGVGHQGVESLVVGQVQGEAGVLNFRFYDIAVPEPETNGGRAGHTHQFMDQPAFITVGFAIGLTALQGQAEDVCPVFLLVR